MIHIEGDINPLSDTATVSGLDVLGLWVSLTIQGEVIRVPLSMLGRDTRIGDPVRLSVRGGDLSVERTENRDDSGG
ncbi:hypothetical protein [Deinococcus sp.]|uniref:hypothetical protein n=1 Tax=Deinococcus sp. TaxID=47478 RepID=UPI003B599F6D